MHTFLNSVILLHIFFTYINKISSGVDYVYELTLFPDVVKYFEIDSPISVV